MKHIAEHHQEDLDIVRGEGCMLFDREGKRYLDFLAGWCVGSVGWGNADVADAIRAQASRGLYGYPHWQHPEAEALASILASRSPGKKLTRAFRCTSGSEAVEFALKCARAATGKKLIVAIDGVYHGYTYGAASVGNVCNPKRMGYCLPGFKKIRMPNAYRGVSGKEVVEEFQTILDSDEGEDVAAFFSEPMWTNSGVHIPPPDFYPAIEKLCRAHGILLAMDEVPTCCGRCGSFYASEQWGIEPDILCMGKGLTGGYAAMAATMVSEEVFQKSKGIPAYSTFGWIPQDLAAARAVVESILREKLWENAKEIGELLLDELKSLEKFECVGDVRGLGLVLGVEIVKDKTSKTEDPSAAEAIRRECQKRGLLIETAGNVLFIAPPLILTKEEAREGVGIMNDVIRAL